MNNFQKAEQWNFFGGVFKNTEQLGGSGITVLLSYTAETFQNHMRSPMYEHELM